MAWVAPKTNWVPTDKFNISDYNRIKNNLQYIADKARLFFPSFVTEDMGDDLVSYSGYWPVEIFNMFEDNLEIINSNTYQLDIGTTLTFYENGRFIKYDELNRIEGYTLELKQMLDIEASKIQRLAFVLGQSKNFIKP